MLDLRKILFDQSAKREKNFSFEFSSKVPGKFCIGLM